MHRAVPTQEDSAFAEQPVREPTVLQLVLSDLESTFSGSGVDEGVFRAGQLAATLRHTPFMMTANILGVMAFAWIAWESFAPSLIIAWSAALILPSAYLLVTAWIRRSHLVRSASRNAIRKAELYAIIMGLAWAAFPAMFLTGAPADLRLFIIAMLLAACGSGAFALSKIPSAGIIFTLIICASLAVCTIQLGGTMGLVFAAMSLLYGMMMVASILSSHHNAVERAMDEARLNQQREIITLLLHDFERGASDWLWETGRDGRLVYFSDRMAEVLNRRRDRLMGATLIQAAGANSTCPAWTELIRLMGEEAVVRDLTVPVSVGGEQRWWQINAQPLRDIGNAFAGYRGVGRDVTREHSDREELLRAKEEAERASAAKSQFLAVMSHELKTPLNAIIGFAEILAAGPDGQTSQAEQVDYARTILDSSKHLRGLINDILDVTRIEKGTVSIIEQSSDIIELIEVAVKTCREMAGKSNVEIVLNFSHSAEITGDITRLKQVIVNLVANAVKFSAHGGTVEICVSHPLDEGIEIRILDHGIGMSVEDCVRVFDPFVQADEGIARRFGGLGLGLPIARKIARTHGGDVTLESRLGHGTTARFTLPPNRVDWHDIEQAKAVTG
jgi:hypothetical protein